MQQISNKNKFSIFFKQKGSVEEEEWIVTYADMITLLFAFFVLLYAISDVDPYKFERVASSIETSVGKNIEAEDRMTLEQVYTNLDNIIKEEGLTEQAEVSYAPVGVTIRFKGNVLFPTASADLSMDARPIFRKLAAEIKARPYRVDVEGHTDDRPVTTDQFPSNWELSGSRASSVVRFLLENQVQPDKLRAIGYADTRPLLPNKDESGNNIPENQAFNRRVEIIFRVK